MRAGTLEAPSGAAYGNKTGSTNRWSNTDVPYLAGDALRWSLAVSPAHENARTPRKLRQTRSLLPMIPPVNAVMHDVTFGTPLAGRELPEHYGTTQGPVRRPGFT